MTPPDSSWPTGFRGHDLRITDRRKWAGETRRLAAIPNAVLLSEHDSTCPASAPLTMWRIRCRGEHLWPGPEPSYHHSSGLLHWVPESRTACASGKQSALPWDRLRRPVGLSRWPCPHPLASREDHLRGMVLLPTSGRGNGNDIMVQVLFDQLVSLANGLVQGVAGRFWLGMADLKPQPLLPVIRVILHYQLGHPSSPGPAAVTDAAPGPTRLGLVTKHRTKAVPPVVSHQYGNSG